MIVDVPVGDARAMLGRLSAKWNVPLSAGLEISDRCNEVCVHCYQEQGLKGELTTEQVFGVLDELAAMGVLILTLSGGEATLRKDFLPIVARARALGFAIRLFTNGLTMTRELANELGRLAVQNVEISLYSCQAETHDFVTGVRGSFERTVAGIRYLVAAGISVTVKTPVMTFNEDQIPEYEAFVASLGAECSVSPSDMLPRENGDRFPETFQLSDAARIEIRRRLGEVKREDACGPQQQQPLTSAPCGAGHELHIEPNGELRPCTMLDFDLGHVLREGVAAAHATNERALALRELTWANLHGCRECDLRTSCARCYASSLAQTGDALGPYAGGCNTAQLNYEVRTGQRPRIVARYGAAATTGPYRAIADGVFEQVADIVTAEDDALALSLGWARKAFSSSAAPPVAARPGELIQIRRPGRKKPKLERIPVGTRATSAAEVARHITDTELRTNAT